MWPTKGILGLIEGGSCRSMRGKKADRQMSSTAHAKTAMKSHEVPLRPAEVPMESMTNYNNITVVTPCGRLCSTNALKSSRLLRRDKLPRVRCRDGQQPQRRMSKMT
jgi:hypothetical protein